MPSIVVDDDKGTQLAYFDTGVPKSTQSKEPYLTIVAVHGTVFSSPTFARLMERSNVAGVRFVAVNRREYPGSTPWSEDEFRILQSGTDAERATFIRDRGVEIATFILRFIEANAIPPTSSDGKAGGILLLGWSLGCTLALSVLANVDALPPAMQDQLSSYLRSYVMFEPPTVAIGSPRPPQLWSPIIDTTLPEDMRYPAFVPYITGYFKHGDLSTRDPDVISYHVPALFRCPSAYHMSQEEHDAAVYLPGGPHDTLFFWMGEASIQETYKKACFDAKTRDRLPGMKIWVLCGDATSPHGIPAFWSMEDDNSANGGGFLNFKWVPGANHSHFWDEPQYMLQQFLSCL
ncbi:hypothetical protein C8Q76DRAFT_779013 [Earliella scabrosa]|nr:hypothetical protein C8Q76DRAFT_779013 [Earliella scabrosa]